MASCASRFQPALLVLLVFLLFMEGVRNSNASSPLNNSLQPRADRSPPGGGSQSPSDVSMGGSDAGNSGEDYIQNNWEWLCERGALFTVYFNKPDADVLRDLQSKDPQRWPRGSQLASRFTDVRELQRNGWNPEDGTDEMRAEMDIYVPFCDALRAMLLSYTPRPLGKLERYVYHHNLWYEVDGEHVQPVGQSATFAFITNPEQGVFAPQAAYGTQWVIDQRGGADATGYQNPPLSHLSDIGFLDYKRACSAYRVDIKRLRYVILPVITALEPHAVVKEIFKRRQRPIEDFDELPEWQNRMCLSPNTDVGQALIGLVQLQGIGWMLLQHRRELGMKRFRQMCIFKDEDRGNPGRGPSIYVELEDVR